MNNFRKKCYEYERDHRWVYPLVWLFLTAITFLGTLIMSLWILLVSLPLLVLYGWLVYPKREYFTQRYWWEDE